MCRAGRLQNESEEDIQTIPTIGFNVETLQYKNIKFQVWDLGGQTSIRPYWRCYYPNTDAIIFVVDSADTERLNIAKQELSAMLEVTCTTCVYVCWRHGKRLVTNVCEHMSLEQEEELRDTILVVFANKQDQPRALKADQVSEGLGLTEIRSRQWSIHETSALQGKGLFEVRSCLPSWPCGTVLFWGPCLIRLSIVRAQGFDWLVTTIKGGES